MSTLADLRKEYSKETLDVSLVSQDPIRQFESWFDEALRAEVLEANAMTLSTVTEEGKPSARIVLLKGIEQNRFLFFTNYQSQKGKELLNNPACALTFFWPELERQVRIEGIASRLDDKASENYFQSRPRGSQIGAWASPQSVIIKDRALLEDRTKALELKFKGKDVLPKPHQWGGFSVEPLEIEFWQGRPNRLHDRIVYYQIDNSWVIHRLAP
ncbi:MAG: pyridoxamine 5'-phosphate oxidase [Cyclobacteriaceae bacterium]|jgi:pyridoxamine 5'-phosphate oxidase|nr:pyridoxamine 5'-phosphate oxidase [Cyclobacteriaceae bacterium]